MRLLISEDIDIFSRVAIEGPWGGTTMELVNYHRRDESSLNLTQQFGSDHGYLCESMVYVLNKITSNPKLNKTERHVVNRKLSGWVFKLGIEQRKKGNKKKARKNFNRALRLNASVKSMARYILTLSPGCTGVWLFEKWCLRNGPSFHT